jgi:hypothetical protein
MIQYPEIDCESFPLHPFDIPNYYSTLCEHLWNIVEESTKEDEVDSGQCKRKDQIYVTELVKSSGLSSGETAVICRHKSI